MLHIHRALISPCSAAGSPHPHTLSSLQITPGPITPGYGSPFYPQTGRRSSAREASRCWDHPGNPGFLAVRCAAGHPLLTVCKASTRSTPSLRGAKPRYVFIPPRSNRQPQRLERRQQRAAAQLSGKQPQEHQLPRRRGQPGRFCHQMGIPEEEGEGRGGPARKPSKASAVVAPEKGRTD